MKILFSFLLTSTVVSYSFSYLYKSLIKEVQTRIYQEISKSTVALYEFKRDEYGSGLVIKKNNKKYILTNSHICNKNYKSDELEKWEISDGSEFVETFFTKNSYKIENKLEDICFIEYMGKIKAYDLNRKEIIFKLSDLFLEKKGIYHFTRNRTEKLNILKRKVSFGDYHFLLSFKDGDKTMYKLNTHIIKSKIVFGDSGSPIFDNLGNFIGQVFAKGEKVSNMMSKEKKYDWLRYEEEKNALHGYATKYDVIEKEYNRL